MYHLPGTSCGNPGPHFFLEGWSNLGVKGDGDPWYPDLTSICPSGAVYQTDANGVVTHGGINFANGYGYEDTVGKLLVLHDQLMELGGDYRAIACGVLEVVDCPLVDGAPRRKLYAWPESKYLDYETEPVENGLRVAPQGTSTPNRLRMEPIREPAPQKVTNGPPKTKRYPRQRPLHAKIEKETALWDDDGWSVPAVPEVVEESWNGWNEPEPVAETWNGWNEPEPVAETWNSWSTAVAPEKPMKGWGAAKTVKLEESWNGWNEPEPVAETWNSWSTAVAPEKPMKGWGAAKAAKLVKRGKTKTKTKAAKSDCWESGDSSNGRGWDSSGSNSGSGWGWGWEATTENPTPAPVPCVNNPSYSCELFVGDGAWYCNDLVEGCADGAMYAPECAGTAPNMPGTAVCELYCSPECFTSSPSKTLSSSPSSHPTSFPSASPSYRPSVSPSSQPTSTPSIAPTSLPSSSPTSSPIPCVNNPSYSCELFVGEGTLGCNQMIEGCADGEIYAPECAGTAPNMPGTAVCELYCNPECFTSSPSKTPSSSPSSHPTSFPSASPSYRPSVSPSSQPTSTPSIAPTSLPSSSPTSSPTPKPVFNPLIPCVNSPSYDCEQFVGGGALSCNQMIEGCANGAMYAPECAGTAQSMPGSVVCELYCNEECQPTQSPTPVPTSNPTNAVSDRLSNHVANVLRWQLSSFPRCLVIILIVFHTQLF